MSFPIHLLHSLGPPKQSRLIWLKRPNSGSSYILPDATTADERAVAIRSATGWVNGTANLFYDAAGASIAVSSVQISEWGYINLYNILLSAKGLIIYSADAPEVTLVKAAKWASIIDYPLLPIDGLIFKTDASMIDSIGLSTSDYLLVPAEHRAIYYVDESTMHNQATIITNLEAYAGLNEAELVGKHGTGYAQYIDGTAQTILNKAISYFYKQSLFIDNEPLLVDGEILEIA